MLPYDPSAGQVMTPYGEGMFIEYLGATQQVVVELDHTDIVVIPAQEVYVID